MTAVEPSPVEPSPVEAVLRHRRPGATPEQREVRTDAPERPAVELRPGYCLIAGPVAVALAVAGLVAGGSDVGAIDVVAAVVVALWAAAGVALGVGRRQDRVAPIVLAGALTLGLVFLTSSLTRHRTLDGMALDLADVVLRISLAVMPALAFHLLASLPDGRLRTAARRRAVAVGYVVGIGTGLALLADRDTVRRLPLASLWVAAVAAGLVAAQPRYRLAGAIDRRRMQWLGLGVAVAAEAALVVLALSLLAGWPRHWAEVGLAISGLVPLALIAGTVPRLVFRVDRLLTHVVAAAGLTALVLGVYVLVVLGFGRSPEGRERSLLLLSMAAAGITALAYVPAKRWLGERANRLVYGERVAPDEALRTFGQRLSRSIPMDELLLQLVESLRKSMVLTSAEVWTGADGTYELAAGVPHRQPPTLHVGVKERPVVARAGVSGGTWLDVWLPGLAGTSPTAIRRVASIAYQGELLGLIVCARRSEGERFTEAEDATLTELARQVGLALHNVQLDSALQASLEELQRANDELRQSRARIVATADAERRKLERNLHDGAQQHLVALAVKLRLAKEAVEDGEPGAPELLDDLRGDLQEAIQELRALAHGIFPPLLVSGGLAQALPAAASRAALPTTCEVVDVGRLPGEVEAAVYFCCLEALQNAGKHAGDGATASVRAWIDGGVLGFEVADTGAGFDLGAAGAGEGHGFVNMRDRLGAFGGSLEVRSAPGQGTSVRGRVPISAT